MTAVLLTSVGLVLTLWIVTLIFGLRRVHEVERQRDLLVYQLASLNPAGPPALADRLANDPAERAPHAPLLSYEVLADGSILYSDGRVVSPEGRLTTEDVERRVSGNMKVPTVG